MSIEHNEVSLASAKYLLDEELERIFLCDIPHITRQTWAKVIESANFIAKFLDQKKLDTRLVLLTVDDGLDFVVYFEGWFYNFSLSVDYDDIIFSKQHTTKGVYTESISLSDITEHKCWKETV